MLLRTSGREKIIFEDRMRKHELKNMILICEGKKKGTQYVPEKLMKMFNSKAL